MTTAFVVPPGEGRLLDLGTFEAVVLADAAQTDGVVTVLQTQSEPSGFGPPLHIHRDAAEAFYVLEGEYLMFLEDREEPCPAGSFVYVPQGVPHTFQVVSSTPGKKLNLFAPAAMVGFFEQLAEAEADGLATPELVDVIAERHRMQVVGPVPESYVGTGSSENRSAFGALSVAALNAGDLAAATTYMRRMVRLHDRMGMTIVSVTDDSAVTTMELSEETAGAAPGSVHGGLLAAFADATAAMALTRSLDNESEIQVTTDMHVRYFRQPRSGPLTATATLVHRGRRILSTECVIRDAEERDLARATATYMVVPRPF